ncbi:hypothetical protein ACH5RR_031576 [Cinchona calisaya]|uniref:Uncharacterized protein n=1 Tax=Cinchona calisaya TaxID=153742 RepID=A0ABD2YII4_9GENT
MGFLLENLHQLVKENGDLICGAGCVVTKLSANLGLLKRFLTDEFSSEKRMLRKKLRVSYTKPRMPSKNTFTTFRSRKAKDPLLDLLTQLNMRRTLGLSAKRLKPLTRRWREVDIVINLENGVKEVIERLVGKNLDEVKISLVRESDSERKPEFEGLEVMSIVGMLGLEKTRLARKEQSSAVANLQTLYTISPESCRPEVFERTPTLKKLGICGKLSTIVEANGESNLFDSFFKLKFLENLKLANDDARFKLRSLPPENKFPAKLTRLSLQNRKLDWIEMSKLGKLKCLMVLKLKDNAFRENYG